MVDRRPHKGRQVGTHHQRRAADRARARMMRRVWIVQCLCPARHCILAAADEAESEVEAERTIRQPLRRRIAEMLAAGVLNPWCGLCDAKRATWRFELRRTRFETMAEAEAPLR